MNNAYLLLGSNQGDRLQYIHTAVSMLSALSGDVAATSSVYETAAWGLTAQPHFLNIAVLLHTEKTPSELLTAVLDIENSLGRRRDVKWGPRTLDMDILLYNNDIIQTSDLIIPHPFLNVRRFVLVPLAEIAGNYIHPILHQTIHELLLICPDPLEVRKYI